MTEMILHKKQHKKTLTPQQKTFNNLKKKVEKLQKDLQNIHHELDQTLNLYFDQIHPLNQSVVDAIKHFVKQLYEHYQNSKLSKKERHKLKDLMLFKIDKLMHLKESPGMDLDIKEIFEQINEIKLDEMVEEEMLSWKEQVEEDFDIQGIDIDLSDIEFNGDVNEFRGRVFEAMDEAKSKFRTDEPRMTQKNTKAQELELLQKKGLSTIYKELAKIFHPDLVQTPAQKAENEILMKKLTIAYKNKDLYTLLSLKIESMKKAGNRGVVQNDDQLKIYNSILKEQASSIKRNINHAIYQPKYAPIRHFVLADWNERHLILKMMRLDLEEELAHYQTAVKDLQGADGKTIIRAILTNF